MTILINLNSARKKLNELEGSAEYNKGVTDAFNALFDLPAIEAEPIKHGRWLKTGQSFVFPEKFRNYFCSECMFELDRRIVRTEYRYCPNCGALMRLDYGSSK